MLSRIGHWRTSLRSYLKLLAISGSAYLLIGVFLFEVGYVAMTWLGANFPAKVPAANAKAVLDMVVNVDGVLIGLGGLTMVSYIGSINNVKSSIYDKIITNSTPQGGMPDYGTLFKLLDDIRDREFYVLMAFVTSAAAQLFSIYSALSIVARMNMAVDEIPREIFVTPIVDLSVGAAFMVGLVFLSSFFPKLSKDVVQGI